MGIINRSVERYGQAAINLRIGRGICQGNACTYRNIASCLSGNVGKALERTACKVFYTRLTKDGIYIPRSVIQGKPQIARHIIRIVSASAKPVHRPAAGNRHVQHVIRCFQKKIFRFNQAAVNYSQRIPVIGIPGKTAHSCPMIGRITHILRGIIRRRRIGFFIFVNLTR